MTCSSLSLIHGRFRLTRYDVVVLGQFRLARFSSIVLRNFEPVLYDFIVSRGLQLISNIFALRRIMFRECEEEVGRKGLRNLSDTA